jgi:6-phosphogluconolactonase
MKRLLILLCLLSPVLTFAQKAPAKTFDLLIGTYTKGKSQGIYVYRFYAESGKLAYLSMASGVSNPSYLCVSDNNKFVYAVNENTAGEASAFKFTPKTGQLDFINKQSTLGADPCYISVDKDQKSLFIANYSGGNIAVLPLNADGSIANGIQTIHDPGHGPNAERQEKAHVHTAVLSPDEKYVLYTDLGTDKLNVAKYKASRSNPLTPASTPFVSVDPGNGPRHLEFSPDHKFVYLLQEMGSAITTYAYSKGNLKKVQTVDMLPANFKGTAGAAAIHITPDGKYLYATNRLDASEIVSYSINQQTGELTFIERHSTFGKNPRDFAIDPTGKYVLVANQDSDSIFVFRINQNDGTLITTGIRIEVGNPVCLKFAPAL